MKPITSYRTIVASALTMMLLLLVQVWAESPAAPPRAHIVVMATTDLHGNILPLDYYTNKPDARGLAKVATIIRQARRETPNLLLLDSGDTIQGTPLARSEEHTSELQSPYVISY